MRRGGKGKIMLIGILLVGVCIVIYFKIPYSPVKKQYRGTIEGLTDEYKLETNKITKEDLKVLPEVLQKYFIENGYLGIESVSAVIIEFKGANFSLGVGKSDIKIDYRVHDFVKEPTRVALIDSKMYGIPFQGIDICKDGKFSMEGIIAKHITLFNENFDFIDSAYLSESLLHPSLALQDNITYKQLDDYTVEATIRKNKSQTTGIFYFNEDYEMTSFVDDKRFCSDTSSYEKWSAIATDYNVIDGINRPTKFQGVWNFSSGDLIYFNGNSMKISYVE